MKSYFLYIYITISIFSISCANQSSPTGGERDEDPPILLSSVPEDKQLNYTQKTIELEFDELIALNNINKELIITPRIEQEYEVKYKKDRVIIEFDEALDTNTTYTFTFRDGIKDLNEGNFPENLSIAFSTGNYLDSLFIEGEVYDLYTNKKMKDISIALYHANDTMDIFNDPPLYLTKTNKMGKYLIDNVKEGQYKVYAFNDKNDNLTLQTSSESYGYLTNNVSLDSSIENLEIPIFYLNVDSIKLQSARTSGQYFVLKYNKYITNYSANTLDSSINVHESLTSENKEIKFYNTFESIDSIAVLITVSDSLQQTRKDTVYIKFKETKREKDKYNINITSENIDLVKPILHAKIKLNKPSKYGNTDSLYLFIDSLTTIKFEDNDLMWNKNFTELQINKTLQKELLEPKQTGDTTSNGDEKMTKVNPSLIIGEGAFLSVEYDTCKSIVSRIKQRKTNSDTGIIKIEVTGDTSPYIIQILNKKNELVVEQNSKQSINNVYTFDNLKAGEYRIRAMIDKNNNGIWELGNILNNTSPEPIYFYISEEGKETITLRSNWEIGPLKFQF